MKVNNGFYELAKEYDAVVFFDTETTGLDADGVDELGQQIQVIELAARRLEIANDGTVHITRSMDDFVKMPEGCKLPPAIIRFNEQHETGINDNLLETEGKTEKEVATRFEKLAEGRVLLVAYNAHFDLCMARAMLARNGADKELIDRNDALDPMTIFKSLKPYAVADNIVNQYYPTLKASQLDGHRLGTALLYYHIEEEFQNSHRAIDDCDALLAVTQHVCKQKEQYLKWIDTIGYNPKYVLKGKLHPKVKYFAQYYL